MYKKIFFAAIIAVAALAVGGLKTSAFACSISPSGQGVKGGEQQFTASNCGTTGVTWSVNGVVGGNSALGTISASGYYTVPPGGVKYIPTMYVVATDKSNPSDSAWASFYFGGACGPGTCDTPTRDALNTNSITPDVNADTSINIADGYEGLWSGDTIGTLTCHPFNKPDVPLAPWVTVTNPTYSFDGGASYPYALKLDQAATSTWPTCLNPSPGPNNNIYEYNFSDSTHIKNLSDGVHILWVCETGETFPGQGRVCFYAPFTVQHALPISVTLSPKIQNSQPPSIQTSATHNYTATVNGTSTTAVTWYVNGYVNGDSNGSYPDGKIVPNVNNSDLAVYTAPSQIPSPNNITVKVVSNADKTKSDSDNFSITGPSTGSISVSSIESIPPNGPVTASWSFQPGSGGDNPCTAGPCTNVTSVIYQNQAPATYEIIPTPGSAAGYAFGNEMLAPIASNNTLWSNLVAFGENIIGSVAKAFSFPSGYPRSNQVSAGKQTTFIIQWDPLAAFGLTPPTLSLNSASPSGSVTVTNAGTQGSTLAWNATFTNCAVNGVATTSCPFTASPLSDQNGLSVGGPGDQINVIASSTGLPLGTSTATLSFTGTSSPCTGNSCPNIPTPASVQVTFSKTSLNCPGDGTGLCGNTPSCTLTANPTNVVVPNSSTLSYECDYINTPSCTLKGTDGSSDQNINAVGPNEVKGTWSVTPTSNVAYSISCNGNPPNWQNYVASQTVNISVSNPGRQECPPSGCTQ